MATHLDLEEQEQLDQLKHFWNTYGTLITWVVLLVAGAFVAWNGWQYYQRSKAVRRQLSTTRSNAARSPATSNASSACWAT